MLDFTVIIKNAGASAVQVNDLGLSIPASGQRTLTDSFSPDKIVASSDLQTLVAAGTLVCNDGTDDLSIADAAKFLTLQTRKDLEDRYYSKTELSTSGSAEVSWNNVIDKPAHGTPDGWYAPVEIIASGVGLETAPETPADGDAYVDDSNHIQIYDGAQWVDNGAASGVVVNAGEPNEAAQGTRVIDASDGDQSIFEFDGTTWRDLGAPVDNYSVIVNSYGSGEKEAQFIYSSESSAFMFYAYYDFSGHFDGGASKHDASEIDVEGTYDNLTTGDLETVIDEIDTALSSLNQNVTDHDLDAAYDAGATITADAGPVIIDSTSGTAAALQITECTTLPTTGLAGGQFAVKDGVLCVRDAVRSKWLSVFRKNINFSKDGLAKDQNLDVFGVSHLNAGVRMAKTTTLTGITCQLSEAGTATLRIRKNNTTTDLGTLDITSAAGNSDTGLNIALTAGDHVQVYLESTAGVQNPVVSLEFAETP